MSDVDRSRSRMGEIQAAIGLADPVYDSDLGGTVGSARPSEELLAEWMAETVFGDGKRLQLVFAPDYP